MSEISALHIELASGVYYANLKDILHISNAIHISKATYRHPVILGLAAINGKIATMFSSNLLDLNKKIDNHKEVTQYCFLFWQSSFGVIGIEKCIVHKLISTLDTDLKKDMQLLCVKDLEEAISNILTR